jgi:hypothetical protein
MKNAEGCPDPTAGKAIHRADNQPDNVELAIRLIKAAARECNVEIIGRIAVKDETGRVWR